MRCLSLAFIGFLLALVLVATSCGGGGGGGEASPTATVTPAVTSDATAAGTPTATASATPAVSGAPLSTQEIVKRLRPSVVHILTEGASLNVFGETQPTQGVGTGIIIDSQGHIVTNNHVVSLDTNQPAQRITVTLSDGRKLSANLVGGDEPTDLAVLQIAVEDVTPAVLGDASRLEVGEEVVAIGHALNLPGGPTVTRGVVSAKDRLIQEDPYMIPGAIQTDAAINPGNSGGPLVNAAAEVVGITTQVIRGTAEGLGFAISIDTAKPIIEELIASGRVERGVLGIRLINITPEIAEEFELPVESGVGIGPIDPTGPAAQAGLQTGDILVRIAGEDVNNSGDLIRILTEHKGGETVKVEYYRDSQRQEVDVTLGSQGG
jgi:S1-C subfamily serine protease